MKISWNPHEVARTKNSSRTNKQLRSALGQTWNLRRHITAPKVFCCCIFGGTLRKKWTSILTGLFLSCVVYPAQVRWTTVWRAHIGKVCTLSTMQERHSAFFHITNFPRGLSHQTGTRLQSNTFGHCPIINDISYNLYT